MGIQVDEQWYVNTLAQYPRPALLQNMHTHLPWQHELSRLTTGNTPWQHDLSRLTTPGAGRPGDGLLPVPLTRCTQMHTPSPCGGLPTPARWGGGGSGPVL